MWDSLYKGDFILKYNEYRRPTSEIKVGGVIIGGNAPISVQSMTNTDTHDIEATYLQAIRLREAGCDIFVAGSAVFGADDIAQRVRDFNELIK